MINMTNHMLDCIKCVSLAWLIIDVWLYEYMLLEQLVPTPHPSMSTTSKIVCN
jgi:hypothetical protein